MNLHVETERESDGRWIAEVPEIPGAMCYGPTQSEAVARAKALALAASPHVQASPSLPNRGAIERE